MNLTVNRDLGAMPDIAMRSHNLPQETLDWVGMSDIHQPLRIATPDGERRLSARVQVYVDLADPHAKGIHMSRLYLYLNDFADSRVLDADSLSELLHRLHDSHADISTRAFVQFDFAYERRQSALLSDNEGWSSYPVCIKATCEDGRVAVELGVEVMYSSTCPCSAALARQLIQRAFRDNFQGRALDIDSVADWLGTEQGILATPHSQRSVAKVLTRLTEPAGRLPIDELVVALEQALGTPVQTAVKREDEQEFALLNGQNLMFCEDAARKLKRALNGQQAIDDFWVRIEHHESLHAHDAVSITTKGIPGGYLPVP